MIRRFLILCLAVLFASPAFAEEKITNFDVDITVSENGDFLVTENITVIVEGRTIRRGIFRDLPRYLTDGEFKIPQRYDFVSVTRNRRPEPYATETDGNAKRLRIGDADIFLPHGKHTFALTYRVKDQIRRADDFDQLYWNITGNYWRYKIDSATASITMPQGAQLQRAEAYTGSLGSTESDARISRKGEAYLVETTRSFAPGEGLSVSLWFDKGVIDTRNPETERFLWWVKNGAMTLLTLSFFLIGLMHYRNWNKVGRDPAKMPVFARYKAPDGYSAAAVSHIHFKGVRGHNALIATLMGLAIKKRIDLSNPKRKHTTIELTDDSETGLNAEERLLLDRLFKGGRKKRVIKLNRKPNKQFNDAYTSFRNNIGRDYGTKYYKANAGYIVLGVALTIIAIIVSVTQYHGGGGELFWVLIGGLIVMNIIFMVLMPAPTKRGQEIGAEIEGFKLYLETAEKLRLDAVDITGETPPPMSIEHYEAMLPYAIALDVEGPWTKYFETKMPAESKEYQPSWGPVGHGGFSSVSKMTDSMISNISSGATSAAPQSSGSSSGGGFSGGGGGGGGGGGW